MLDKVPNQRIVPFVEDHRNLLILAPLNQLSIEAMATLQAALKRGIGMTFQIEESELVAEPLPTSDNRKALMFYEAAEGGAGVLTRLSSDPQSLAQVASAALRLLHHHQPTGAWSFENLEALEQRHDGNSICEAGCYQCLLSYFNQPDHTNINRRNVDALKLLVALANAQVVATVSPHQPSDLLTHAENAPDLSAWLNALDAAGLRRPDATQVPVGEGTTLAAGQYKSARTLVFLTPLADDLRATLVDKGWRVLDFSDATQWLNQFEQHPDIFGTSEKTQ